mgnify:CR=1 FL=1
MAVCREGAVDLTQDLGLGGFLLRGLFSDLKHHDMGAGFRETDFGGTHNTVWRTPPLWGVGSGFPWGHDGASLTLEDAILRHDGEGAAARRAWMSAPSRTSSGTCVKRSW